MKVLIEIPSEVARCAVAVQARSIEPPAPSVGISRRYEFHERFGISQSQLSATGTGQNTTLAQYEGSAKVTLIQLVGRTEGNDKSLQCFDNYDENLNPVNCRSAADK